MLWANLDGTCREILLHAAKFILPSVWMKDHQSYRSVSKRPKQTAVQLRIFTLDLKAPKLLRPHLGLSTKQALHTIVIEIPPWAVVHCENSEVVVPSYLEADGHTGPLNYTSSRNTGVISKFSLVMLKCVNTTSCRVMSLISFFL